MFWLCLSFHLQSFSFADHVWVLKQMFVLASLAFCHQPFLAISWEFFFQINFLDDYIWLLNNIILFQFTAAGCRRTSKADLIRMDIVKKVISKCCTKGLSDSAHSGYMSHSVGQASCLYIWIMVIFLLRSHF